MTLGLVETVTSADGGDDSITTGIGNDIVLGGQGADVIKADYAGVDANEQDLVGTGTNLVLGDNGSLDYTRADRESVAGADTNPSDLDLVVSVDEGIGGSDTITTGDGSDLVIGGTAGDIITVNDGNNLVLGDSGQITAASVDGPQLAGLPLTIGEIVTTADGVGGVDHITSGLGQDIVLGGHDGDEIDVGDGNNLVLGDSGRIDYTRGDREAVPGADVNPLDLDLIESTTTILYGGVDIIISGAGSDLIVGGRYGDQITAGDGNNLVIGDSGRITAAESDAVQQLAGIPMTFGLIETVEPDDGGNDTITTLSGNDIVLGGDVDDTINAGEGNNIVLGDNGYIDYVIDDGDPSDIDQIWSTVPGIGGVDHITTGAGDDIVIGGTAGDTVTVGDGDNIVIGDSGQITSASTDLDPQLESYPMTLGRIETIAPDVGGNDFITTGIGRDIVFGGAGGDQITANDGDEQTADGNNLVLGDNGYVDYVIGDGNPADIDQISSKDFGIGGSDTITTGAGNDIIIGGADGDTIMAGDGSNIVMGDNAQITSAVTDDPETPFSVHPLTLGAILTIAPTIGGSDSINTGSGNDIVFGGTAGDTINAGGGNDLVFGDHGMVDGDVEPSELPMAMPINDHPFTFTSIDTQTSDDGGNDTIYGEEGDDILIGGQGDDTIYGGADDDDLIGGHNVAGGHDGSDRLDGGLGNDVIIGDNASVLRTGDAISPRMRALSGEVIYDSDGNPLVTEEWQPDPADPSGKTGRKIEIFDHSDDPAANTSGVEYIAGGGGNDLILGGLGNDIIQGDGSIDELVSAERLADGTLSINPSFEASTDGDDYIEGGGGDDLIFGNLGQDDIIGGSSSLFGQIHATHRPDGEDTIFGGAGTDTVRNDLGDLSSEGHARDADVILGDNGNIYRLVGTNGTYSGNFLSFGYDNYSETLKIIPRATELLDYTPGGLDYFPTADLTAGDIGAADEIHGESGDDSIYGMKGDDVLFGEGQDDDLIGGYDNDWISGGTGQDGILGDDGRIYTSRNGTAETLYGIGDLDGELDQYIYTPGKIQQSIINVTGELKKSVNLTPFKLGDPDDLDYAEENFDPQSADDIIYGGLGDDFLHGGDGDDAISGAEALPEFYNNPFNPGDVLRFGDFGRAGEFGAYNEYDPWSKVYVDENGEFATDGTMYEFLLNFEHTEGPAMQDATWGIVNTDGNDVIFGDLGNDWLVGGTGRDHLYGGYGNDLMNADDDHSTNEGLNDAPDTHPSYEDLAYGGAGRDVLIANTGGDRLIDWAGEFNSFIVPFAPFGMATVSRALQPQIAEYLYDLSASDGADPTRAADTGSDPDRNGEPEGELGLVRQKDFDWHDQTGAPDDPQPGNIPGGRRDVLRSATFNTGQTEGFFTDSGVFTVENGSLSVSAESLGGDAVSVFHVNEMLPQYFELQATINATKPTGGWKSNAFVIFDYQNEYDFKFAGINVSLDKIQMGHRTEEGWIVDVQSGIKAKPGIDYNMLVAVNGTNVTVLVDGKDFFSYTFDPRVDADGYVYGLNSGMVGFGSDNSRGTFDNMAVQILPPEITFEGTEEFPNTDTTIEFVPTTSDWNIVDGHYDGAATGSEPAISLTDMGLDNGLEIASILELEATLNTEGMGGFVFDYYGPDNFKFASISAENNQVVIGHYTEKSGWSSDAVFDRTIEAGEDYDLNISLKGTTVNVSVKEVESPNWQAMVGHVFNAVVVDGDFGLLSKDGGSSFDDVTVKTDDRAFQQPDDGDPLMACSEFQEPIGIEDPLTYAELAPIIDEAIDRWAESLLIDENVLMTQLNDVTFQIADLSGSILGLTQDNTIIIDIDAAGHGWFVDSTPEDDSEFMPQNGDGELEANPSSMAYGDMDLLSVVMHEIGHVLGFDDLNPETNPDDLMSDTLDEGVRRLSGDNEDSQSNGATSEPSGLSGSIDDGNIDGGIDLTLTVDTEADSDTFSDMEQTSSWVEEFVVDLAEGEDETDPNDNIAVVLTVGDTQTDSNGSEFNTGESYDTNVDEVVEEVLDSVISGEDIVANVDGNSIGKGKTQRRNK